RVFHNNHLFPFIAGFSTPPSKPGVRLSPHRAFPCPAFLAPPYDGVRIPFVFTPYRGNFMPHEASGYSGRLAPAALRPVAAFSGLRLLWRLRRPLRFTGRLLASVSRGLPRSRRWTLQGRLGGGY